MVVCSVEVPPPEAWTDGRGLGTRERVLSPLTMIDRHNISHSHSTRTLTSNPPPDSTAHPHDTSHYLRCSNKTLSDYLTDQMQTRRKPMQEIPLTPTSQTARAHSSSLSERVSDTHTVPPGIPHSTDHTNWAMSWSTSSSALRCRISPIVTWGSNRCITSRHCPTEDRERHGDAHIFRYGAAHRAPLAATQPSRSLQAVRTLQPHNESCPIPPARAARALPTIPSVWAAAPIPPLPAHPSSLVHVQCSGPHHKSSHIRRGAMG